MAKNGSAAAQQPAPPPTITYGFSRDHATGCWVYSTYELPDDVAAKYIVAIGEPRHMSGNLAMIGRDVSKRNAGL